MFAKSLVNVVCKKKLGACLQNFYDFYNKNIIEYAQIVVTHVNSRILDIMGHSTS